MESVTSVDQGLAVEVCAIAPEDRGYGHCAPGDLARVRRLIERVGIYNQSGLVCAALEADDAEWDSAYEEAAAGAAPLCVDLPSGERWEGTEAERDEKVDELRAEGDQ